MFEIIIKFHKKDDEVYEYYGYSLSGNYLIVDTKNNNKTIKSDSVKLVFSLSEIQEYYIMPKFN